MTLLFANDLQRSLLVLCVSTAAILTSSLSLAQELQLTQQLEQIKANQELSRKAYHRELTTSKETAIEKYGEAATSNCDDALRLARGAPADPTSLDALQFVVRTARGGPTDQSAQAFALLAKYHSDAPLIGEFCVRYYWLSHFEELEQLMRQVRNDHPQKRERACATYALGLLKMRRVNQRLKWEADDLIDNHDGEELSQDLRDLDVEAAATEAVLLFKKVCSDFGDIDFYGAPLSQDAKGKLFGVEHLRIGSVIPEISGLDHNNVSHSLSALRGRIVVLTFSGDWCGNCKAMYPQLRKLRADYESKGLSIASVATDKKVDTLRQAITNKNITWRCWWDGEDGEIVSTWGISAFPSIFIIDRAGVIRFKNLRGRQLEKAILHLIDERSDEHELR